MHVAYFYVLYVLLFFFKQKTAYEMRISDWSSDVCSSDLRTRRRRRGGGFRHCRHHRIAWRCRRALRQGFRRRPSGRAERQQPTFPGDRRMSWINRVRNALPFMAKKETTAETLWPKCPSCAEIIFIQAWDANLSVCPRSASSQERRVGNECVRTCR